MKAEEETAKKPESESEDDDEDGIFGADTKPVKSELKKEEPIKPAME